MAASFLFPKLLPSGLFLFLFHSLTAKFCLRSAQIKMRLSEPLDAESGEQLHLKPHHLHAAVALPALYLLAAFG